jgi:hypothetical protein
MVPAIYKYLMKIILFSGFWNVEVQTKLYLLFQRPIVLGLLVLTLFISILICVMLIALKGKREFRIAALFFLFFLTFVFPVLNLYYPYWINIHADRYCYLPTAFLLISMGSILYRLRSPFKYMAVFLFFFCSVFFLVKTNESWAEAGKLQQKLESNFRWWDAKRVFILNLPDNLRGAYLYRNLRPSQFSASLIKQGIFEPKDNIIEVLSCNLNSIEDSVTVEKVSTKELKVTLTHPDVWWWQHTLGATDY